jgi:hypothetical protein
MTIAYDSVRTAELIAGGLEENPAILWDNIATASNITSRYGDEAGGPATNAVTGTTYDAAIPTLSGGIATLEVSGSGLTANAACIYAHNIADTGASVRIQYSDDGGTSWTDAGAGLVTPTDNQAIMWRFDESTHDDWRVQVFNAGVNQPIIGGFCIGTELIIEQRFYQGYTPPITPTNVMLTENVSEGAHILGSKFQEYGSTVSVEIQHVQYATIRSADWIAFQNHHNRGGAFLWAWRPTKTGDVFWARTAGAVIAPTNTGPKDRVSFKMELSLYHES